MTENTSLAPIIKDIGDKTMEGIKALMDEQGFKLPEGYNAVNEVKSAGLRIMDTRDKAGRPALEVCTKASAMNSILDMVIQGLSPSKKQCYFIVYGNQLQLFRSYFGTQCALRRAVPSVHKVVTDLVREGDEVEWATNQYGERYIGRIITDPFTNYGKPYKYGFCNIYSVSGDLLATAIMSWQEIQTSWKQSRNWKPEGGVHQKFPEEMAKRTLISRACKNILNSSAESDPIVTAAFNHTTDNEYGVVDVDAEKDALPEKKTLKERYQIGKKPDAEDSAQNTQAQPDIEGPEQFDDSGSFYGDDEPEDIPDGFFETN